MGYEHLLGLVICISYETNNSGDIYEETDEYLDTAGIDATIYDILAQEQTTNVNNLLQLYQGNSPVSPINMRSVHVSPRQPTRP